ncbi:hypothetical protein [uncultured Croceitalea sp.]|uniref:hypothetical protein n=1 Tax=uncultured Croceitalea sp. TaxID=1798908 RepID=UPI0033064E26
MKYFLIIIVLLNTSTCLNSKNDSAKIKKKITRQYSTLTKPITNELKKNELEMSVEFGLDKQENQTYAINYLSNPKDTTWYTYENSKRKIGDKTCFYQDSTLVYCRIKKNDTIRLFFPPNIDTLAAYHLYDKKGNIGGIYPHGNEKFPYKKSILTQRKFDSNGNLTYYVETDYYLPKEYNLDKNQKHLTLKKGLLQARNSRIVEIEYEYYK